MDPNVMEQKSQRIATILKTAAKENLTNKQQSEITIKEFLDFLKMAYQVSGSIENVLIENGLTDAVQWLKMKENSLVKPSEVGCQTEDRQDDGDQKTANLIRDKLNEILDEGLMDSILPHAIPSNASVTSTITTTERRTSTMRIYEKGNGNLVVSRKKSRNSTNMNKKSSEVVIHVSDEAKNEKKDFICNERLLLDKMGYFAEVAAGQRLEDMDIAVHCDVAVFEWLMFWMKRDTVAESDWTKLNPQCVVPILVAAAFLQMEPLVEECLLYCHTYMNDILRTTANLSCMNDAILTRLAAKYTNEEMEAMKDRKGKIQPKLFFKLIEALCEPEPEWMRGHWASYARIYRCARCHQLVSPSAAPDLPCVPATMQLLRDGSVRWHHEHDPTWNINDHVEELFAEWKTWRLVYWRMWANCHFLYCVVCKKSFPVHQMAWCRHHPDAPQYFTVDAQRAPLPVGRFPCCGERAFRFELLKPESGCQFKDHVPCTDNAKEAAIFALFEKYQEHMREKAPKLFYPERLTRLVNKGEAGIAKGEHNECFWWEGLQLIPPRPRMGLLGAFAHNNSLKVEKEAALPIETLPPDNSSECSDDSLSDVCSSAKGSEEEVTRTTTVVPRVKKKRGKKRQSRLWQFNVSARSNQDVQRTYEENATKQMGVILARHTPHKKARAHVRQYAPSGGIWLRLENEWKTANNLQDEAKSRFSFINRGRIRIPKPSG